MVLRLPVLGGAQIIAFAGLIETTGFFQASSTTDGRGPRDGQFSMKDSTETGEPGNYGVGFPNFLGKVEDPEARKSKLAAELANGRLAMMATRQHISMFYAKEPKSNGFICVISHIFAKFCEGMMICTHALLHAHDIAIECICCRLHARHVSMSLACLCFWTLTSFFVASFVHWILCNFFPLLFKAIIGMFFQDGLTGSAWGDWSLYTASPLRAEAEDEPPKPPPFDPSKQVRPSVSVQ